MAQTHTQTWSTHSGTLNFCENAENGAASLRRKSLLKTISASISPPGQAGWLGLLGVTLWKRTLQPLKQFEDLYLVSRWIEEQLPTFRNDISASLQFGQALESIQQDDQMSTALVKKLLSKTQRDVQERSGELLAAAPAAKTGSAYKVLAVVSAVKGAPSSARRGCSDRARTRR